MKKAVFIFIICITCIGNTDSIAQKTIADSLLSITDTSVRITYLNNLSARYIGNNKLDSAALFAGEALQLAQFIHDDKEEATALYYIGDVYISKGKYKKALSHFLRSLRIKREVKDKSLSVKLYFKMANVFARLKLYPQALKCYYKMMGVYEKGKNRNNYVYLDYNNRNIADSLSGTTEESVADSTLIKDTAAITVANPTMEMTDDTEEGLVRDIISDSTDRKQSEIVSQPIEGNDITECFNDGKKAVAYGLMVHVKQPSAGKRKVFASFSNVGHTFVTLIKFNADSTTLSRSFGFYPRKDNLLSATPLIPTATSVFKDDSKHEWDEVVGKFISKRKFDKIIRLVKEYRCRKYNLNSNNCTDFGLDIAAIAGIKIKETVSSWPLGKGNNPANAGQSIREGKVKDDDKDDKDGLLIIR